ncbi:hypothetical protein M2454_001787 [Aequitasia blattaphilus]|uniref:SHOCT-like domain-containing protein n=1 Tax=Aequitasia blattaphilus TaxID=2949332 RepID=A0ABT1E942_9FIRM|nr:SHOCT domain-containing protein [Aequitasia blattaphilus]MCP1102338.1 hypothetical protein [Aequitasia blattaphilus]MCR8614978.1 hypothetical protein [Aequitasia blattaphilus]
MYEISKAQEQAEFDYHRGQIIIKTMLDEGLISLCEYNKITELNRQDFSPFLAEIMPKLT